MKSTTPAEFIRQVEGMVNSGIAKAEPPKRKLGAAASKKQAAKKQIQFGFVADIPRRKIERLHSARPERWSETPAHDFGFEVALLHPSGDAKVIRVLARKHGTITIAWPNMGGRWFVDESSGVLSNAARQSLQWRLSDEDIGWLRANRFDLDEES